MRAKKRQRQSELQSLLDDNPFLTDQELAERFAVSIQTIRLDRMELGIPELRERVKMVANDAYAKIKSLGEEELIGDLWQFEPEVRGVSTLDATMEMIYEKTMTVRAEHIFAQANSLAVFMANSSEAITVGASVQFLRPVYAGERLVCTAAIVKREEKRIHMDVTTTSTDSLVFSGKFILGISV
ncbi:MAG TPA: transcription factor FapR [Firmicutes bacterium]|jgi:acyl-coenzyme A thioesterase PaaI-like protein|nr:transcription factor FapR [Bacillota bacterium]